jgi:protein-disulfide isomerase
MNGAIVQSLINKDMSDAEKASVEGTPAVFVNGKILRNGGDKELQDMIEAELKRKK